MILESPDVVISTSGRVRRVVRASLVALVVGTERTLHAALALAVLDLRNAVHADVHVPMRTGLPGRVVPRRSGEVTPGRHRPAATGPEHRTICGVIARPGGRGPRAAACRRRAACTAHRRDHAARTTGVAAGAVHRGHPAHAAVAGGAAHDRAATAAGRAARNGDLRTASRRHHHRETHHAKRSATHLSSFLDVRPSPHHEDRAVREKSFVQTAVLYSDTFNSAIRSTSQQKSPRRKRPLI